MDFNKVINRKASQSIKWEVNKGELPLSIADMDFKTCDYIIDGFKKRIDMGDFGYTDLNDEFYKSYINWWKRRHNFNFKKEWMMFSIGVVPSISSIIRRMSEIANNVVILTPVYNIFYNSILNNGRHVLESKLIYKDGNYFIDFEDLEKKLALKETSILLFCNPHNPIGKIYSKEELIKVGELAKKYNVFVISDEIHCDLTRLNKDYIPFASVNNTNLNNSVTLISPTKAFNLAGIQTSCIICKNEEVRHKINRGINTSEIAEPNVLAAIAPALAFSKEGEKWLNSLRLYIDSNIAFIKDFIANNLPEIRLINCEATYLLWLDISKITSNSKYFSDFLKEKTGLILNPGLEYGKGGEHFLRLNAATQISRIEDAMNRLKKGVELFKKENK